MRASVSLTFLAALAVAAAALPRETSAQLVPAPILRAIGRAPAAAAPAADAPATDAKEDKDQAVDVPRAAVAQFGPKQIRLHLLDGSVITGDLSVSEISVETPFGKLVVPIDRIRSFTPGLDSNPKLAGQIETLIKNLGSDDYQTREQAHKDLAAMGLRVRKELDRFTNDDNAEIKRHVGEIIKEMEEQAADKADDEEAVVEQPWARLDTVVTTDFTVLGKVAPQQFEISSKYGPLTIQLADVRQGEREVAVRESFRKTVSVDGSNLAQRSFKNTGIRVQAGDKINLKAEGSIVMSPWGSNAQAGPDGAPNYGWYVPNQIPGGALVARVGDKGTVFKVGRQSTFVAKNAGVLQLAIGIQAEYANEGYAYPGQYSVRLRIDPK